MALAEPLLAGETQLPDFWAILEVAHRELAGIALVELSKQRKRVVVGDQVEAEARRNRTKRAKNGGVTNRVRDSSHIQHDLVFVRVTARATRTLGLCGSGGLEFNRFCSHASTIDLSYGGSMGQQREKSETASKATVITVSDRGSRGEREDESGPHAVARLTEHGYETTLTMVRDGSDTVSVAIRAAIEEGADVIITSGGTGVGPRDLTPEGTRPLLTREIPGIAEELRRAGAQSTPRALLSRGLVGIAGTTLVVNLPGSVKGINEGLDVLLPLLEHILDQVRGGDH